MTLGQACCKQGLLEAEVAAVPLLVTVEAWLLAKDKGGWQLGLTARTARGRSGCLALAIDSIGTDSKQHVSK
jgi:hypothetical protein